MRPPATGERCARAVVGTVLLIGCGSSSTQPPPPPPPPELGTLTITTTTTGPWPDLNGYRVVIDGQLRGPISVNGTRTDTVAVGTRRVTIEGVASNCVAAPGAQLSADISRSTPSTLAVQFTCGPRELAFATDSLGGLLLAAVREDGTGFRWLSIGAEPGSRESAPGWSPDGSQLVFSRQPAGATQGDLWIMNADGSGRRLLSESPANEGIGRWSPDGQRIAFRSDRSGNPDIWVINADGTGIRQLTTDPAVEDGPTWSPDGTRIAFQSNRGGIDGIWVINADGTNERRLSGASESAFQPTWSPDGTRFVFGSRRDGPAFSIYEMQADGTLPRRILLAPPSLTLAQYSPDGSLLAASALVGSAPARYEIRIFDRQGNNVRALTSGFNRLLATWRP